MWNGSECKWVKRNGDRLQKLEDGYTSCFYVSWPRMLMCRICKYLGIYNRLRLKTKADVLLTKGVSYC